MKSLRPIILLSLLSVHLSLCTQAQWYQNQDGNNPPPYGTVATAVLPFTSTTFIACYLWSSNNEQNTWKISKSNMNGTEQKAFFSTATSSSLECKKGKPLAGELYILCGMEPSIHFVVMAFNCSRLLCWKGFVHTAECSQEKAAAGSKLNWKPGDALLFQIRRFFA